jgi:hypothetical protein
MDGNNCPNGAASCSAPFRYSPIDEIDSHVTGAAPLFYGMLLVSHAGSGPMFPVTPTVAGNINVTAYAIGQNDGSTRVVIVNKDSTQAVDASVDVGTAVSSASADYLQGPSLTSKTEITFAGAGVSPTGSWTPAPPFAAPASGNVVRVLVPPISAVLVHAI